MKKLNYEYVKEQIESEGYKLLSKVYININSSLEIMCDKGHVYKTPFTVWKRGGRCRFCQHDSLRLTIEFVRSEFEKEGYTLSSDKYCNAYSKLFFICPNGHEHFITWGNWRSGFRCGKCARNVKFTTDFVRQLFEKEGYTLITKEYINQKQKLSYICPVGHTNEVMFSDWLYGNCRCSKCRSINMYGEGNHQWKGGISYEQYCPIWKDKEYKESIKERDGYECQNPDCFKKQGNAAQLTVHHIDYNKKNCGPANLITLCRSCNSRANKNKSWHKQHYMTIMNNKYNFNYKGV